MSKSEQELQEWANGAAICTLFEGDYHLGLAAFVNSLVRAGYKGTIWAGYRGALPSWIGQLERVRSGREDEFRIAGRVQIVFLKLNTDIHFTNYKPQFMLDLLKKEASDYAYLWYFDPDIFLQASWSFFHNWQNYGIALCQEIVDNVFPADNPLRQEWAKLAAGIGLTDPRPIHHYYNGGMVGVPSAHADFLEMWKRLLDLAAEMGYDLRQLGHGSREKPFTMSDQDALNIAAMYSRRPLTTLGPQGMGFILGASMMMYHAVGPKPWRGSILLRALRGLPPSGATKFFFANVSSPVRAYHPVHLWTKRRACALASFVGRFYRRY